MNNQVISLDLGDNYLYISLNQHLLSWNNFLGLIANIFINIIGFESYLQKY